jgi:O-methyltransferase involved in polyketide biosynthesis
VREEYWNRTDNVKTAVSQAISCFGYLLTLVKETHIPADRPTFIRADGLLAFLSESVIIALFRRISDYFAEGQQAFNDYGRVGPVSRLAVKLFPQKMFKDVDALYGYPGFKDAHHPQVWNPRLRLVEETSLAHQREVGLFPTWLRVSTRLFGLTDAGARKARILRYAS